MNGDPRQEAALIAATPLPMWAANYKLEVRADGRPFLHATIDGCEVWAQPKAWSMMTLKPSDSVRSGDAAGTLNYGVQMQGLASHSGRMETNDPAFGGEMLGAGHQVPLPNQSATDFGPYAAPALILAVGLVVIALIHRFKRAG